MSHSSTTTINVNHFGDVSVDSCSSTGSILLLNLATYMYIAVLLCARYEHDKCNEQSEITTLLIYIFIF